MSLIEVTALSSEMIQLKEDIRSGKQPVFDSIDALIDKLKEV